MIALPLPKFAAEGLLHGVTIQSADDIRDAAESQDVTSVAAEGWSMPAYGETARIIAPRTRMPAC